MFEFSDKDIDSEQSTAYDAYTEDENIAEYGFILTVNDADVILTESEIQYMQDQVNKLKGE